MSHVPLRSPVGRVLASVGTWLLGRRDREEAPASLRVAPPDEAKPSVPAAYMPLYHYLNRRYAITVVLTFKDIEALLGFAPPPAALSDAEWWTGPSLSTDRHAAAWTAARRSAVPKLSAGIVAFERLP
jgi:hypothetical protein